MRITTEVRAVGGGYRIDRSVSFDGETAGQLADIYSLLERQETEQRARIWTKVDHGYFTGSISTGGSGAGSGQKMLDKSSKSGKIRGAGGAVGSGESETTCVGEVDFSDKKQVMAVLDRYQEEWKNLDYEMDCTITTDGKVWVTKGGNNSLDVSLIDDLEGSYSYHNHPKKYTNFSFSDYDIGVFIENKCGYCKVSDHKYEYIIKRTRHTGYALYDDIRYEFSELYRGTLADWCIIGKMSNEDLYHYATIFLCAKYGLSYERKRL